MCVDYSKYVSELIFELDNLREKAQEKAIISEGLNNYCKIATMESYLTHLKNTFIMVCGVLQYAELIKDQNTLKYKFALVKQIYNSGLFRDLYKNEYISSKLVFMYQLVQRLIEETLFEKLFEKINNFTVANNDQRNIIVDEVCDIFYDFSESSIFLLSGLRLNDNNLKDELLEDPVLEPPGENQRIDRKESSCFHDQPECFYLIITPWVLIDLNFLAGFIDIIKKYHNNHRSISIIIDYLFVDKGHTLTDEGFKRLNILAENFDNVYLVNYYHINLYIDNAKEKLDDMGIQFLDKQETVDIRKCLINGAQA